VTDVVEQSRALTSEIDGNVGRSHGGTRAQIAAQGAAFASRAAAPSRRGGAL
jgi:hypothetical protein